MSTYTKLTCSYCNKDFQRLTAEYNYKIKTFNTKFTFCSPKCFRQHRSERGLTLVKCANCDEIIKKRKSDFNKTKNSFCNHSCAATFNNKLKRKSRRSKIEAKFYNLLVKEFPKLNILSNDKTMLDGYEVDIAIPELNLAIEWNGIVHFKPIYGQTKLDKIQNRDTEKLKIASNKDINLIVIPDLVSNDKILKQAFDDVKIIIGNLI